MISPTAERPRFFTRPALAAARRPKLIVALWLLLIAVGTYAFGRGLDREGFPPVNVPLATVDAIWFVDDATRVDQEIAQPVYAAIKDAPGVASVQTFSRPDGFLGFIEFESNFTSPQGVAELESISIPGLPEEVTLTYSPIDATKFLETYDMVVTVIGPSDASPEALETEAEMVSAWLQRDAAITETEVLRLLTESVNPATGQLEVRQTDFNRYAEPGNAIAAESIGIGIIRNLDFDADVLEFSRRVQDSLDAMPDLGPGYRAVIGADFATEVQDQLDTLTSNLLFGLIAVAVVSYLLIGWRSALITAAFMGTVMLTTMAGLWVIGYSLNTITFFALVLTLGLLVDDAIVVTESIDSSREDGDDISDSNGRNGDASHAVVRRALDRVGSASFAGTLSTITVFAPMAFVTGILGEFIRPIPITVILTLSTSFLLSITLIPALGRLFLLQGSSTGPLVGVQRWIANRLGRLALFPAGRGLGGFATGFGLIALGILLIVLGMGTAARIGFNIFPPTKDSNVVQVTVEFDPGTTIEEARLLQDDIDATVLDVLGDDLDRYQVIIGDNRQTFAFIELVPFNDRSTTSPTYADRIEEATNNLVGARVGSQATSNGPPAEDFPFRTQIVFGANQVDAATALAAEITNELSGQVLDKTTGDTTTVGSTFVASAGQVWRVDGRSIIEIRAQFDTQDTTGNLTAAERLVKDLFPPAELSDRGLDPDALEFDYGLESDNQDDFAVLGYALMAAIVLMLVLLMIQFRSLVQPFLIFLAVPFSFFGVFTLLEQTNNLSFLVMVGFIALVGVAVNNTILLVDAANQERRRGLRPSKAIAIAVEQRFRPLLVTTATTVAGLLPLALSDPFWEALCFVLIGGLASSTALVLIVFPAMYLGVERARLGLRRLVAR